MQCFPQRSSVLVIEKTQNSLMIDSLNLLSMPTEIRHVRFRLGSHFLPIETGRWNRTPRNERLCSTCGVLGDENHVIYSCSQISCEDIVLDNFIDKIRYQPEVFKLFERIKTVKFL